MQWVVQNTKFLYKESEYSLVMYKWKYAERATAIEEFEILWHIPHLEDLFRVAEEKNKINKFEMNIDRSSIWVLWLRVYTSNWGNMLINKIIEWFDPTLPLLNQPSLPEIISLFN